MIKLKPRMDTDEDRLGKAKGVFRKVRSRRTIWCAQGFDSGIVQKQTKKTKGSKAYCDFRWGYRGKQNGLTRTLLRPFRAWNLNDERTRAMPRAGL